MAMLTFDGPLDGYVLCMGNADGFPVDVTVGKLDGNIEGFTLGVIVDGCMSGDGVVGLALFKTSTFTTVRKYGFVTISDLKRSLPP